MKYNTKLKIINFVKRLIKWEDKPVRPFIIEERKVKIARFYRIYGKEELEWLNEKEVLDRIVRSALIEDISKTKNAILYEIAPAPEIGPDKVRVEAFLLFVIPKEPKDINLSKFVKSKEDDK